MGAVVAYLDMSERVTIDIDFFGNSEENKSIFKDIATELNIDFDPSDYQFSDKPYLQWVNPNFVHMPKDDIWKKDIQSMWDGEKLHVYHPPIGIILCSKLAASREKDIVDVKYLSDKYPKWEKSIEKYIHLFSTEDQQEINDNKIFQFKIINYIHVK